MEFGVIPQTPNPKSQTPNPKPQTPHPKPQTPDPKPETRNRTPQTLHGNLAHKKPKSRTRQTWRNAWSCCAKPTSSPDRSFELSLSLSLSLSLCVCGSLSISLSLGSAWRASSRNQPTHSPGPSLSLSISLFLSLCVCVCVCVCVSLSLFISLPLSLYISLSPPGPAAMRTGVSRKSSRREIMQKSPYTWGPVPFTCPSDAWCPVRSSTRWVIKSTPRLESNRTPRLFDGQMYGAAVEGICHI